MVLSLLQFPLEGNCLPVGVSNIINYHSGSTQKDVGWVYIPKRRYTLNKLTWCTRDPLVVNLFYSALLKDFKKSCIFALR